MPANTVEINGSLKYTIGDSFAEALVMFLERYCYENMPDDSENHDDRDTVFGQFMFSWSKAHYGKNFDFDTCVIKKDIDSNIYTVTWTRSGREIIDSTEEEKQKSEQGQG